MKVPFNTTKVVDVASTAASFAERGIFWAKTLSITVIVFCLLLIADIVVRIVK